MIRFQCPHCRNIIAADPWTPNAKTTCADCGKEVQTPESRFSLGAVLGDFLLEKQLGAGGMGIVFLAHQLSLDRPAAIKVLNPEFSKEADSVRNFIREARSAAKLNHPNIVQAYAVGEDEGIFYFAMEYIDGETMKETLKRQGKIDFKEAAKAVMQVADGLDTAWREQKLIHHDIKPDNIMHCSNDRYKLSDLGLSQVFGEDADDDSNEVLGTPQYISPEQLTGVVTDTRSDIYSLGATFYHLVTGQFPYNGENTDEIARKHVYEELVPPIKVNPMLPQELNDVIVKMMAKNPADRFQDCSEIVKVLRDYLEPARRPTGGLGNTGKLDSGSGSPSLRLENTAKAQIILPPSQNKLSLHLAQPKTEDKAATSPAAAAKPVVIKLNRPVAKQAPAPAPAPTPAPVATPVATPVVTPVATPVVTPVADSDVQLQPVPADDVQLQPVPVAGEAAKEAQESGKAPETALPETEKKSATPKKSKRILLIGVIAAVVLLCGGAAAWFFLNKPAAENTQPKSVENTATEAQTASAQPAATEVQTASAQPAETEVQTVSETPQPAQPAEPEKTPFELQTEALSKLAKANPQAFLQEWRNAARTLTATSDAEAQTLAKLEARYVELDEKLNVRPARESLLSDFAQAVKDKKQRETVAAHAAKIAAEDEKNEKAAAESPEKYKNDLSRRKMLLDHAMIRAARSGSEEDWDAFKKLVVAAKREPQRYADDPQSRKTAEELAKYAREINYLAIQGRTFTQILASGTLNGQSLQLPQGSISIENASPDSISYTFTPLQGDPISGSFHPLTDSPELGEQVCDAISKRMGRSDQLFYYMVYNGFLKNPDKVDAIAPKGYWQQKKTRRLMRNYFRRAIFIATPDELEALRGEFGDWASFKWAEKNQP